MVELKQIITEQDKKQLEINNNQTTNNFKTI